MNTPVDTAVIPPWIVELPKVELHVHLEGSMSPTTVGLLAARHGAHVSSIWPHGLPEKFSFDGFPDFARQFLFGLQQLRTGDDLETAVIALGADLAAQNVRYAEVTTTVYSHLRAGMSAADYGAALDRGQQRVRREHGVELSWVIDIPRDLEPPESTVTVDFLAGPHAPIGAVAIGLGGYEVGFPPEPYADSFARARALGLASVPHAGETEGAPSVRGALDSLGAVRIGHGVRCLEDGELVRRLVDEGIMLEVCPTSNVLLGVAASLDEHPLPNLRAAGVRTCVNTDDPGMFATDLSTEFIIAHTKLGLARRDLVDMQIDALAASFAPAEVRARVRAALASA
jgi:aminodeoxyfutalosine deaminase